ncbi:hypothetical protein C1645_833097 [Glomus cerebriforme]|uniref:F-box domain-containing protein n=1 Tax=Glomus cerebriforme TaxID=658196 RepID=A0A397SMR2_9GLOM|nr:hypothetical protein C1645_833097 [Glomus cerebriforme]
MVQLPVDCLNEIFEYLEDDIITLHSCLLVNRLWCEVSLKIFWRNVEKYHDSNFHTLIACLPNESKEILYKNGIIISNPTSKPPMFNYASFCKVLSIDQVHYKLEQILRNQQSILLQNLINNTSILAQEILKLFMIQISSLKELDFQSYLNTTFDFYPGAKCCLKNLSKLSCSSNISSEFFYQLSQICHNILSLNISVVQVISKGLSDLISSQKNLKYLGISYDGYDIDDENLKDINSSFTNPNNLSNLYLWGIRHNISLSFIIKFINLQELRLSFEYDEFFKNFEELQYAIFPKLQILKIQSTCTCQLLTTFLENNGKTLKELYVLDCDNSLYLAITKFCPNLKKLTIGFENNNSEKVKLLYKSCQYLESVEIW